jgi:serine/threonine-protein phosphatase 5
MRIVGDVHGQYQDLVTVFGKFGLPSARTPYLFNSALLDRGSMGVEMLAAVLAWKLTDPSSVYINRGNQFVLSGRSRTEICVGCFTHSEQRSMNEMSGFPTECAKKYKESIFEDISEFFNTLLIGHVLNKKVLRVHGGLFADRRVTLTKFQSVNRFCQPPEDGPFNDVLWSDPMGDPGLAPSLCGVTSLFGPDITAKLLRSNHLELLIRSHQVQEQGCAIQHGRKCVTVFSAPNYVGQMANKGAVCTITFRADGSLVYPLGFTSFDAQPIPSKYPPMRFASSFSVPV